MLHIDELGSIPRLNYHFLPRMTAVAFVASIQAIKLIVQYLVI